VQSFDKRKQIKNLDTPQLLNNLKIILLLKIRMKKKRSKTLLSICLKNKEETIISLQNKLAKNPLREELFLGPTLRAILLWIMIGKSKQSPAK